MRLLIGIALLIVILIIWYMKTKPNFLSRFLSRIFKEKESKDSKSTAYLKTSEKVINDPSKPYPCAGSKLPDYGCVLERVDGLKLCDESPECVGYLEPDMLLKSMAGLVGLKDPIGLLNSDPVKATDLLKSGTFYKKSAKQ